MGTNTEEKESSYKLHHGRAPKKGKWSYGSVQCYRNIYIYWAHNTVHKNIIDKREQKWWTLVWYNTTNVLFSLYCFIFVHSLVFTKIQSWIYPAITKDPGESAVTLELPTAAHWRASCAERKESPDKCLKNTLIWCFYFARLLWHLGGRYSCFCPPTWGSSKDRDRLDPLHCASEPVMLGSIISFSKVGPQLLIV